MRLHATLALNGEGLPLGVLRCAYTKKLSEAKTRTWMYGLRDIDKAAETLPRKTQVLCVMDREADFFKLFAAQRTLKRTHVVVRAKHDRRLGTKKGSLFAAMRKGRCAGVVELAVARLSRRAKSGRVTHKGRKARSARMEMRYHRLTLPAPKDSAEDSLQVSAIHMREVAPPEGAHRIEWYLLTTAKVTTAEEAQQMVEYSTLRWRVEDIFRILKSGCKVEKLRMQHAAALHKAITLHLVTAWRVMLMTLLGRVSSDMEAEVIFTDEAHMMRVYARELWTCRTHGSCLGHLDGGKGGSMNRKHDPPPGHTIMWRGYASLQMRAIAYEELTYYERIARPPP